MQAGSSVIEFPGRLLRRSPDPIGPRGFAYLGDRPSLSNSPTMFPTLNFAPHYIVSADTEG